MPSSAPRALAFILLLAAPGLFAQDVARTRLMNASPKEWKLTVIDKILPVGKIHIIQKRSDGIIQTLKSVGDSYTIAPMEDIDLVIQQTAGQVAIKVAVEDGTNRAEFRFANPLTKKGPVVAEVLKPSDKVKVRPKSLGEIGNGPFLVLR